MQGTGFDLYGSGDEKRQTHFGQQDRIRESTSTAARSTFRTAANRDRVTGRIRTEPTTTTMVVSITLPSARTHVHHLEFRDRQWYRRKLCFERGRPSNSRKSIAFPVVRKRSELENRCKLEFISCVMLTGLRFLTACPFRLFLDGCFGCVGNIHEWHHSRPEQSATWNSRRRLLFCVLRSC